MNALGTAITALATLTIVGCGGGGEPSLAEVERVAKRELRADTVTCNRNAPPHEYQCDFTRTSDYGVRISDTAWLKSDGDRIWVTDPGG
jgi:hypothetical protein